MASHLLYPPIVDSYMPAFVGNKTSGTCRIYFTLSKFNVNDDFGSVHISIINQATGRNMVNLKDSDERYRRAGIILNVIAGQEDENKPIYYVDISSKDINGGWKPGTIYKVQLRLVEKNINSIPSGNQEAWLNQNASHFSEWSTVCVIKAISGIFYNIPYLSINNDPNSNNNKNINNINSRVLTFSTLDLSGSFIRIEQENEPISSYRFILYDDGPIEHILEDSGDIYVNQYETNNNNFRYIFKTEFEDGKFYKLAFKFTTINKYEDGFYKTEGIDNRYVFQCSYALINNPPCFLVTVENDIYDILTDKTSREMEEDEGRVALKFYTIDDYPYSGNLCIRRSDSRTNFSVWTDIYIHTIKNDYINNAPIIYDYTIESGVYYLYGVQEIDQNGFRSKLDVISKNNPIMRNFNYTFLLGKNNQQLKLMFDNVMGNFKYQVVDSKVDPIGSKYGNVSRNAATYYRTFPVNGLISFWMDENKLFCNKKVIYKYEDIINLYDNYNTKNNIVQYDYIYERDFREKVLEFLQNGEFKLFKSPTEGNIIVRLMDVSCIPNQSLDRMLYSFTANAFEMADNTMDNYLKYGFYSLAEPATEFKTYETRLGQIQEDFNVGTNIIDKIIEKYDTSNVYAKKHSQGSLITTVDTIFNLKITFDDKPLRIKTSADEIVMGNNIQYGKNKITVYNPARTYEFDENIILTKNSQVRLLGPEPETYKNIIPATVDFLYKVDLEIYKGRKRATRETIKKVGQIFKNCSPFENLYQEIALKYYLDSATKYQELTSINFIEIEADPGAIFNIEDVRDSNAEQHVVGKTGILRLYDITEVQYLTYLGMQNPVTGELEQVNTDVVVNYGCTIFQGDYVTKGEE